MLCMQGCTSAGILEKEGVERGVTPPLPPKASLIQIDGELTGVRAVLVCTVQRWWLLFCAKQIFYMCMKQYCRTKESI